MRRDYELSSRSIPVTSIENKKIPIKTLYLSEEPEGTKTDQKFIDISYSFSRQNTNNKNISAELLTLRKTMDSLQKQHQTNLNEVRKQVDRSVNSNIRHTNTLLQKIMICNFIFLFIIILTFFKGKI